MLSPLLSCGVPRPRRAPPAALAAPTSETPLCSSMGSVLDLRDGQECRLHWEELRALIRPTQPSVGHAWVLNIKQRNFAEAEAAQESVDGETMPVVTGEGIHGDALFLIDHHHLLSALDLSGFNPLVRVHMACRLTQSSEAAIWTELFRRGWAFPHSIPALARQNFSQVLTLSEALVAVPRQLRFTPANQTLVDDPWRSLAGFARKLDDSQLAPPDGGSCPGSSKFCMRAYDSPCRAGDNSSIPFLEFRWAHFFARAHQEPQLWPSEKLAAAFEAAYAALPRPRLGAHKALNVAPWFGAAAKLVPLARSRAAAEYRLPDEFGPHAGALPGAVTGMHAVSVPEPECEAISCSTVAPAPTLATGAPA
jgi:hypothetical protein